MPDPNLIFNVLVHRFNQSELRLLCHDIGVPYDDLPGQSLTLKKRELVEYMKRRAQLADLADAILAARDDISPSDLGLDEPTP